ncbi:MAG: CHASE2 domain-containing protein [Planctomycetes bacterium]|nr:CHASE2 domain-containing protein [Planctomycetota bacterium]
MTIAGLKILLIRSAYVLIVLAVLPLIIWNGFIQQAGAQWNDLLLRMRGTQTTPATSQIVLLAIDDRTVAQYGPLPLNRATLATGLEALAEGRPRVLAVDLLIAEPGEPRADDRLRRALHSFPNVVLGAALESDADLSPRWIMPIPAVAEGHSIAHVHAAPDPDGNVRAVLLRKEGAGRRLWALGLEAVRLAISADRPLEANDSIVLGSIHIPAAERDMRSMLVHYAGPEGVFPRVSFMSLLAGSADPSVFRDKIVILGVTAQGSGDRLFTPVFERHRDERNRDSRKCHPNHPRWGVPSACRRSG